MSDESVSVKAAECFHGVLSASEAARRLRGSGLAQGYLTRESDVKAGRFIISYLEDTTVKHIIIPGYNKMVKMKISHQRYEDYANIVEIILLSGKNFQNQYGLAPPKREPSELKFITKLENNPSNICYACDFEAKDVIHLASHKRIHHVHLCKKCKHYFKGQGAYRTHRAKCRPEDVTFYKCEHCEYRTPSWNQNMKRHVMFVHNKPYECKLCNENFRSKEKLSEHTEKHLKVHLQCRFCSLIFSSGSNRTRHEKSQHKSCSDGRKERKKVGRTVKRCSQCEYKTTNQTHLTRHSEVHNKERKLKPAEFHCYHCVYRAKSKHRVWRHMKTCKGQSTVITMIDTDLFCSIDT